MKLDLAPGSLGPGISQNEVHLWVPLLSSGPFSEFYKSHESILSQDERDRYLHFSSEESQQLFFISRVFIRKVLSLYADLQPHEWKFTRTLHGRPEIQNSLEKPFSFNLSHSKGKMICAVSSFAEVGVDLETLNRKTDMRKIARRVFSQEEWSLWEGLSEEAKRSRFYQLWTLKESYIKARGMGFNIPLDAISFQISPLGPDRESPFIGIDLRVKDDPTSWTFNLFKIGETHQGAIAVRTGPDCNIQLILRKCRI